jgi:hypothetical protein
MARIGKGNPTMTKRFLLICGLAMIATVLLGARERRESRAPMGILRHTAAFNFKPGVPQETIDRMLADARATVPTIEGTSRVVIGPQTSNLSKYKYGMSIDFANREAKAAYARSPQSRRLHDQYKEYIEDETIIDIVNQ